MTTAAPRRIPPTEGDPMTADRDPVADVWELLWETVCDFRDTHRHPWSMSRLIDALMPVVVAYGDARVRELVREQLELRSELSAELDAASYRDDAQPTARYREVRPGIFRLPAKWNPITGKFKFGKETE